VGGGLTVTLPPSPPLPTVIFCPEESSPIPRPRFASYRCILCSGLLLFFQLFSYFPLRRETSLIQSSLDSFHLVESFLGDLFFVKGFSHFFLLVFFFFFFFFLGVFFLFFLPLSLAGVRSFFIF